jgi:hypothetical protein
MDKENQSLLDFLQTMPLSSFIIHRSPISNKEAQTLYDIWLHGEKDEYGKNIMPNEADPIQVASLTTKGYLRNHPSRFATRDNMPTRTCEFTEKGKDVIQKIILHKEKSSFEKSSSRYVDFESICRSIEISELASKGKTASLNLKGANWLSRCIVGELQRWKSS